MEMFLDSDIHEILENTNEYHNTIDTRENVLKTLLQHKIMYAHSEIKNKIDNLSEDEMTEIFKIIKNNKYYKLFDDLLHEKLI